MPDVVTVKDVFDYLSCPQSRPQAYMEDISEQVTQLSSVALFCDDFSQKSYE